MTCARCRAAHEHPTEDEKAAQFQSATEHICGCERYRVSPYSPGAVTDEERLHLLIMDPQSLLDGWLHPSKVKRFTTSGQSVLRESASIQEFEATAGELQSRAFMSGRQCRLFGVLTFSASSVRYCATDRLLCIFDTATEEKPNHADLMCAGLGPCPEAWSKSRKKQEEYEFAREVITAMGREFSKPDNFRGGALAKFASP